MQIYYFVLYFFIYAFLGWCTEVIYASVKQRAFVNRGFLNGPICPVYGVGVGIVIWVLTPYRENVLMLYGLSVIVVTAIEGVTGYIMDKLFHHKWWDYSMRPLNIGGYVCMLFSLVWGVACVAIVKVVHPVVSKAFEILPFGVGLTLVIILAIVMSVDLYVSVSGILKLNRRLEAMDKIAKELNELSKKLGSTLHENVMESIELQEKGKRELLELKERYKVLVHGDNKVHIRLLKAFPKIQSRKYRNLLEELKAVLEERWKE